LNMPRLSPHRLRRSSVEQRLTEEKLRVIDEHGALVLRTEAEYLATIARLGKRKVHLQKLVIVFKQKWLAKNVKDRKKVRITVGT